MIRYDTTDYINVRQKLTSSQLSLPHGTKQKKSNEESKNRKRRCSEETVQSWQIRPLYDYQKISSRVQTVGAPTQKAFADRVNENGGRQCACSNEVSVSDRLCSEAGDDVQHITMCTLCLYWPAIKHHSTHSRSNYRSAPPVKSAQRPSPFSTHYGTFHVLRLTLFQSS